MPEAIINSELLAWARHRARMDVSQLAKMSKASTLQVKSWELGTTRPSLSKAAEMARTLRIPFAYLFLSQPPTEELQIPDLRTVSGEAPRMISLELRDVLQSVLLKQEWFREYRESEGEGDLDFTSQRKTVNSPEEDAALIKDALAWSDETRRVSGGSGPYLTELVRKAESLGILVMRSGVVGSNNTRKLSVQDFRGFAIADNLAPVIFINSNDAKSAQVFTFAHELAHIWFGRSGISDPDITTKAAHGDSLELRCNSVAASLVAPASQMRSVWLAKPNASLVAAHFRVSEIVILRRALDLQLIDQRTFNERAGAIPHRVAKKGEGGNFHATLPARNSPLFTRTLLADVKRGRTGYRDAARLLAIKPSTIVTLEKSRASRL